VFVTVLHRLVAPGSDRAAEKWKQDYAIEGAGQLALHHFYRALAWLGAAALVFSQFFTSFDRTNDSDSSAPVVMRSSG